MRARAEGTRRLFIGVMPEPAVRDALQAHQATWRWAPGARPTAPERLHLTVHFLGPVDAAREAQLADALVALDATPFDLTLDRPLAWPGGLAVLGTHTVPPALATLHDTLAGFLRALEIPLDARPYAPHVTLARHAGPTRAPDGTQAEPVPWHVHHVSLIESRGGYTERLRVTLAPAAGSSRST